MDAQAAISISLRAGALAAAVAALFAAAVFLRGVGRLGRAPEALAFLVISALTVWHSADLLPTAPRTILARPPAVLGPPRPAAPGLRPRLIAGSSHPYRRADRASGEAIAAITHARALPNIPARFGFAVFPGAESFSSAALARYLDVVDPVSSGPAQFLGAEYLLVPTPRAPLLGLPPVALDERGAVLLSVPGTRQRAFVTSRWRWAGPERIQRATTAKVQPFDAWSVWLEGEGPGPIGPELEQPTPCAVESDVPERVNLTCESRLGGYAVLLEEPAPGWTAVVDGQAAPIQRADGLFRAVPVPPGRHSVDFSYRTPGLRLGIAVSLAAAGAWLAALVVLSRRRRAASEASAAPASSAGPP